MNTSVQAVNDDIDGKISGAVLKGKCYESSYRTQEQFADFQGHCLSLVYAFLDVLTCYVVLQEQSVASSCSKWAIGVAMPLTVLFAVFIMVSNILICQALPVFAVMFVTRVIRLIASPEPEDFATRTIHLLVLLSIVGGIWKREYELRCDYKSHLLSFDLARDRRNLEISCQVKKKEIEIQAIRNAKHMISECFNTVLIAAQRLQLIVSAETEEKERENTSEGKEEHTNDTLQATSSKSELQLCGAMILSAQEDYIGLQENYNSHKDKSVEENIDIAIINNTDDINISSDTDNKASETTPPTVMTTRLPVANNNSVLIVDDNQFCREFVACQVRNLLKKYSTPHEVAVSGKNVQLTLDFLLAPKFDYDLVLIDMNMPGTPSSVSHCQAGIWCTHQYKLLRPHSSTNFVCMSGLGRDELLQEQCRAAGMAK